MLLVAPRASVAAIIPVLRRPEQALLEPSEVRTATHLALQHLAAVDVAFDWAMTPGQGDAGFAGVIVIADSLRKPLPGHERTLRRPGQPGIPRLRRPLAHERGHVLGASDGGGHLGMLGSPVGALGRLVLIRPLGSPSHPPGRPTGREVASCRLCHGRQGLPRPSLPRRLARGLAQALGRAGDGRRAPRIPTPWELAEEAHGITAPRMPPFEAVGRVGREETTAALGAALARGQGLHPAVAIECLVGQVLRQWSSDSGEHRHRKENRGPAFSAGT
jgi:hypothetical protein